LKKVLGKQHERVSEDDVEIKKIKKEKRHN